MRILTCNVCGYERSTEEDGRQFSEDKYDNLICSECWPKQMVE